MYTTRKHERESGFGVEDAPPPMTPPNRFRLFCLFSRCARPSPHPHLQTAEARLLCQSRPQLQLEGLKGSGALHLVEVTGPDLPMQATPLLHPVAVLGAASKVHGCPR